MDYILGPEWDKLFDIDKIFDNADSIPNWRDPRYPNLGGEPMPNWIQELADWSMNTGNRKKIDKLIELSYSNNYKTPWTKEQIEEFKYGTKIKGLKKPDKNIVKYIKQALKPREVFHRDPEFIFDKFDLSKAGIRTDGTKYNPSWGKGAYVSIKNDPSLDKIYGTKISRFYERPGTELVTPGEIYKSNTMGHPYFEDDFMGKKYLEYLKRKGYSGIDNRWEHVFYFPDEDLLPANTPLQRVVNRIPTQTLGKIGNKVNKALQPVLTHPVVQTGGKVLNALDKYGRGLSAIMLPQSVMYQFDNGQGQVW